jgi:hypothetical protein
VAPSHDRKGSEYANFDCQEQVNAGQKVVQLGHARRIAANIAKLPEAGV